MSDVMMFGIARMPYEMAMDDELSRLQFYQNTQRLAAALEAAREDAWQPIETAPKDGTRVMLGNAGGTWIAYWRPVFQSGYRPKNPWASAMLNHDHIAPEHRYKRPTHWRNVPAIDQARGKGGGEVGS